MDGAQINLNGESNNVGLIKTDGPFDFEIRNELSYVEDIMRPVIRKDEDDDYVSRVGPAFEGTFSVVKSIRQGDEPVAQNVTTTSYTKLAQIQGLTVRCLPFGSFTSLDSLHARIRNHKVVNTSLKTHKQKPQREAIEVPSTKEKKRKRLKDQSDVDDVEFSSSNNKSSKVKFEAATSLDAAASPKKKSKKT